MARWLPEIGSTAIEGGELVNPSRHPNGLRAKLANISQLFSAPAWPQSVAGRRAGKRATLDNFAKLDRLDATAAAALV